MLIPDLLAASARKFPDKPALWHKGGWTTYAALDAMAGKVAAFLLEAGIRRGDRVGLLYENSPEYVASHFGILKAGAVNVSLNTETTADTIAHLLADCGAAALIVSRRLAPLAAAAAERLPSLRVVLTDLPAAGSFPARLRTAALEEVFSGPAVALPPCPSVDIDLAAIVYTSGSTGKPKGVMLSHLNLVSNNRSIVEYLGIGPEDRVLSVLPFYYIYGTSLLYTHFSAGGSVVLENRFAYPNVALDTLQQTACTGFAGVPSTFAILLGKSTLKKRRFESLRYVTQAGGAMAPSMQKEVAETFSPARLFVMYGATEAAPRLTFVEPEQLPRKWGSIGKAIPNVEVIVAGPGGERLGPGEAGEVAARGSNIMMGYWQDHEGTAEVLRHGWYYTGDLGRVDEDGYIFLEGRAKDIIKAGGNRVGAKEIEETLMELPEVLETAVIGVADPILGEAILALVVPRGAAEGLEERLRLHSKTRLPPYKQPKWFEIRNELPKNESGKILKQVLRAETAARYPLGGG